MLYSLWSWFVGSEPEPIKHKINVEELISVKQNLKKVK